MSALRDAMLDPGELRLALEAWADKYSSRIDSGLTDAWPDMEDRLQALIRKLSVKELALGPGKDFEQKVRQAIENWARRHAQPIIDDASAEYQALVLAAVQLCDPNAPAGVDAAGSLEAKDLLGPLEVLGGVLGIGGAIIFGIAATTKWLIIPILVFHWPLLIAGLLVGGVLLVLGVTDLATIRSKLAARFQEMLLPKIKEALIGEGYVHDGKEIPSIRRQMKDAIEHAAAAAVAVLRKA